MQILNPSGIPVNNSDENNLWIIETNGNTWSFKDASNPETNFADKQEWNIRWSSDPGLVFLYVIEEKPDPNEPDQDDKPPDYFWEKKRQKYLYRQSNGTLDFEDLTQEGIEPDVTTFGWKFRNEKLNTRSTVTSRLGSNQHLPEWTIDDELHARVANVPHLDTSTWNNRSNLRLFTVQAENVVVDALNVSTMGKIRFPPSFRSRTRLSIQLPVDPYTYVGSSETNDIELQSKEHVWVLSNERSPNTWTITSETSDVSFSTIRFRRLNFFSGYFVLDTSDASRRLYLNHNLEWIDFTQQESSTTFEQDHPELRWDVTSAARDASFAQYATNIIGGDNMIHSEKTDQTVTLRHATLSDRGLSIPTPSNLLSSIETDDFGHVIGFTPFDPENVNLLRRQSVLQYEQKGWDAVGSPNDLETLQDWTGVVEDQYARSWWTTPALKPESLPSMFQSGTQQASFANAITSSNNYVLFTPHRSKRLLIYDPFKKSTEEIDIGTESDDFSGGVLTENGEIALVPYDESRVAFVRHPTWNARYGEDLPDVGAPEHRFFGGVRTTNNQIVCAPFDADRVAVYDERLPDGQRWFTSLPLENIGANKERYRGAVFCPDGQVVCIPHAAHTFLHVLENGTLFERLDSSLEDGLYVPDEDDFIRSIDPGAFELVAQEIHRQSDVTIVIDARFPTIQEVQDEGDMCLFNAGETVRAVWIGVRRIGGLVEFYARAGDSSPPPNNGATILRFPNATFLDGRVHRLVVDIQPGEENGDSKKGGQMRVFVDDLLRGRRNIENILAFARPDPPQWAGPGTRNMYGGVFHGQTKPRMPLDETDEPMSANPWFGFPHTLLSPVRLYSGLRNTQDSPVSIPRTALLNWDRAWIHQIDTPKLMGYDTMMEVPENPSSEFGELQREWRDPSPSSEDPHYPISIETSVFPKNPRALNNEQADTNDVYWRNWSMLEGQEGEWKYSASSVLNSTYPASLAFQDNSSAWRSGEGDITPQNTRSLFMKTPEELHPRGYTIRSWYNSEDTSEHYRPSEWKLYGILDDGITRTELDSQQDILFSESSDPNERTRSFSLNTNGKFSRYELEITRTSNNAPQVAIELWDMTFSPYNGEFGRPVWKLMNKNIDLNAASGWRIWAENLASNADAIVTYHEPRRLHAVEITAGPKFNDSDPLGIKSVQVQGRNDTGDVWKQILTINDRWTNPGDIVEEKLDDPSKPFSMFRLLISELPEGANYVSVQEWNLKTSAPLPVEDMFENEDPFVVELGGVREEEDPENPIIHAYWGGAFTSRGIICAPYDADWVGIYDVGTRQFFQSRNVSTGKNKYAGARTLSNGLVALFPHSTNANLLIYDPTNDVVVSEIDVGAVGNAYNGGALTFDGELLLVPYDSQEIRILDTGIIPHPALVTHPSFN